MSRSKYPIERKPRPSKRFPHGGGINSERHWNDHKNPLNRRRHHGTDPLKDGFDPGEDPLIRTPRKKKPEDFPI